MMMEIAEFRVRSDVTGALKGRGSSRALNHCQRLGTLEARAPSNRCRKSRKDQILCHSFYRTIQVDPPSTETPAREMRRRFSLHGLPVIMRMFEASVRRPFCRYHLPSARLSGLGHSGLADPEKNFAYTFRSLRRDHEYFTESSGSRLYAYMQDTRSCGFRMAWFIRSRVRRHSSRRGGRTTKAWGRIGRTRSLLG